METFDGCFKKILQAFFRHRLSFLSYGRILKFNIVITYPPRELNKSILNHANVLKFRPSAGGLISWSALIDKLSFVKLWIV